MRVKTKNKTFNDISSSGLFSKGGTVTVQKLATLPTYNYCVSVYKREVLEQDIERDSPIWYVSQKGGIKFKCFHRHVMNENQKKTYDRVCKIWNSQIKKGA